MKLQRNQVARMIDVSAVQAYHSEQDLRELVEVARANAFIAVHSLPCWTPLVAELLRDRPDIVVGAPVGFPSGAHRPETKRFEARTLVEDGVGEMDVMMNIGKLKSGDDTYVLDDIAGVREEARDVPIKVIIETPHLSRDEVIRATRIVVRSGAAFVKTGSGWTGESVDLDTLRVIVDEAEGAVQVKAAGGIRTLSTLEAMYDLGVRRFGINTASALSILDECGTGSS